MNDRFLYKYALDLLGAAGDALIKLSDGFKHLVITGSDGYNHIAARRIHKRLVDLSARGVFLLVTQYTAIADVEDYITEDDTELHGWKTIVGNIESINIEITSILDDVRKERSDFVLEDAYLNILNSLNSRKNLAKKLTTMPFPMNKEEREQLSKISEEYKRLFVKFSDAIKDLNLYLKQRKQALNKSD